MRLLVTLSFRGLLISLESELAFSFHPLPLIVLLEPEYKIALRRMKCFINYLMWN